jgi:hypothetical protein
VDGRRRPIRSVRHAVTPGDVPSTTLSMVCWPRLGAFEIVLRLPYSLGAATKQAMVRSSIDGRVVQEALWKRNDNPAIDDVLSTPNLQTGTGLAVSMGSGRQLTIEVNIEGRREWYHFSLDGLAQAGAVLTRRCRPTQ